MCLAKEHRDRKACCAVAGRDPGPDENNGLRDRREAGGRCRQGRALCVSEQAIVGAVIRSFDQDGSGRPKGAGKLDRLVGKAGKAAAGQERRRPGAGRFDHGADR